MPVSSGICRNFKPLGGLAMEMVKLSSMPACLDRLKGLIDDSTLRREVP